MDVVGYLLTRFVFTSEPMEMWTPGIYGQAIEHLFSWYVIFTNRAKLTGG